MSGHRLAPTTTTNGKTPGLPLGGGRFNGDGGDGSRGCAASACGLKDRVHFRADFPDSIDVQSHLKDCVEELLESSQILAPRI